MKDRFLQIASPILLLLVWEVLARFGVIDARFFSMPSEVVTRAIVLINNGTLLDATLITLRRVAVGFVLAGIPAVLLGIAMGVNRPLRLAFSPLIAALYPIPKIALVPMILLIFGLGENAKYAVVIISVFFLVTLNTLAGVLNVDPKYFDVARNNGAKDWDLIWTVALPGALPSILTGLNLGLGFALTVIVGTELLVPQGGLGALIWQSYQIFDIASIFAALIVVAVLGWASNYFMQELERQIIPWRMQPAGASQPSRNSASALTGAPEPRIRKFVRTWWMAVRPFSFTASVTPVVLGAVIAAYDGYWDGWYVLLALAGSVAIHAGTNLINDYYDWKKGTDTPQSLGPNRPMRDGLITPRQVFIAALLCFGIGSLIGLYIVATHDPHYYILIIGVLSVLAGWFYTAGPRAFAYTGLGEVIVFIFMGLIIVLGSYYVIAQTMSLRIVLMALPLSFLVTAILHANNMRDIDEDLQNHKRTLANILGRRASQIEYTFLVGGSYALLIAFVLMGIAPWPTLLTLLMLPTAIQLIRRATRTDDVAKLNRVVRATAQLHSRFGWLMIIGVIGAIAGRLA